MQDVQNIPNPDINSYDQIEDDFNNHSDTPDISRGDENRTNIEQPVPPDRQQGNHPIEEPPSTTDKAPIEEDNIEPKRIV